MYCENCGTSLNPGSKFCSACGNKIEADESSPRASQSSFTGGRRQNSSYNVPTILLISIPALFLVIVVAWLIIPKTFQSTTSPIRQPEERSAPKLTDPLSPSDSDIKSLLEAEWNKESYTVPLGNFDVIGGFLGSPNVDASRGAISTNTYNELIALQKVGLVTVRHDERYEKFRRGESYTSEQFGELTQKHVQRKIAVTPTDRGRQYLKSGSMDKLEIRKGKFRITKIVKNEEHKKGVDKYRLVMATYDAEWSPDLKAFRELMGIKLGQKRKIIELLKFDPFESKWKGYTWDDVNANEEFKTNNVARVLASAQ